MCNPGELKIHRSKVKFLAFAFRRLEGCAILGNWRIHRSAVKFLAFAFRRLEGCAILGN